MCILQRLQQNPGVLHIGLHKL